MRKVLTSFCICLLLLFCPITAFAATSENTSVDVKAQYIDNTQWDAVSPNKDGTAAITLSDGTKLTISDIKNTDWQLVVELVTEKEPLDWLDTLLNGKLNDRTALHIFFLDENGTVHTADDVTVTIETEKVQSNSSVYSVSSDGSTRNCEGVLDGKRITFTTNGSEFYVYGSRLNPLSDSPKTGNTSRLASWFVLLALIGTSIAFGAKKSKQTGQE